MKLIRYIDKNIKRIVDLNDLFCGQTCILMGGAPSLKEQPIHLLEQRGVLTMAMNNAAVHFRPTMWISGDNPRCYARGILEDPTIIKFAPHNFYNEMAYNKRYYQHPNTHFFTQKRDVPYDRFFEISNDIPWYNNTLFGAIYVLYALGIKRIILGGSDFIIKDDIYAHKTNLGEDEKKWNKHLYNSLASDLRMFKPIFDSAGIEFIDCSKNSRLSAVYKHITLEEVVNIFLQDFSGNLNTENLPHGSQFAPKDLRDRIINYPIYLNDYNNYFNTKQLINENTSSKSIKNDDKNKKMKEII